MAVNKITIKDRHGNVLFRNSFAGVDKVNVDVDPNVGTPEAVTSYNNGELTIQLKNFKGNGIASLQTIQESQLDAQPSIYRITDELGNHIDVTVRNGHRGNGIERIDTEESQQDDGENIVKIKTTDDQEGQYAAILHIKNGKTGNGIASSSEELSNEDGGVNTHTFVDDKGVEHSFHTTNGKTGATGPQGAIAVYDSSQQYPPFEFDTVPGRSDTKGMTQKGITEALEAKTVQVLATWSKSELDGMTKYQAIDPSTGKVVSTSSAWGSHQIAATSYRGRKIRFVTGNSFKAVITFVKSWVSTNGSPADFCDGITGVTTIEKNQVHETVIPTDCTYIYVGSISQGSTVSPTEIIIYKEAKERLDELEGKDAEISGNLASLEKSLYVSEKSYDAAAMTSFQTQWPINGGNFISTSANNAARRLTLTSYRGKKLVIKAGANTAYYALMKSWPSASGTSAAEHYCDGQTLKTLSNEVMMTIPDDCRYLYIDYIRSGSVNIPSEVSVVSYVTENVANKLPTVYLSANGDDDNDGASSSSPKATFEAAMRAGAIDMTVVLMSDLSQPLNLSTFNGQKAHVSIRGGENVRRRIILGKTLEGLEPLEGYDDVYTWTPGTGESVPTGNIKRLWQHDLPDSLTTISTNERHPLQRGRECRRLSTCITHASTLNDLLSAETPCWVVDSGTLYIRVAEGSDVEENPVVVPTNDQAAIVGCNYDVSLYNIEAWYARIQSGSSYNFKAVDCAARYTTGSGAWQIDNSMCVHLERCEADSNTMPSVASGSNPTGDGFNLHPTSSTDIYAKGGTHTLIDCWAHDNRDDGYSDHGRSEGTIIGGLYEYNGKGGLTPSTGAHDTIYNATCRNHPNGSGILYTGAPGSSEGGKGGQVQCFGCVCHDNKWNYKVDGANTGSPEPNRMVLNHCISRNATTAALYAYTNCMIIARDCTDQGSASVKSTGGGAVITIDNGTVIS